MLCQQGLRRTGATTLKGGALTRRRNSGWILFSLPLHLRRHLQTKRIESNKARCVILVVRFGWISFHCCDRRIVQADGRLAPSHHNISLIELHANGASYVLLAFGYESLKCQPLRREPISVVNQFRISGNE